MVYYDIFNLLFPFFIVIFGVIIFTIIKNILEWNSNNNQPIIPVEATVVSKRAFTSYHHYENHTSNSTTYYVTFQFNNGQRMEFNINARHYSLIREGEKGILSFQGTRFISFDRIL